MESSRTGGQLALSYHVPGAMMTGVPDPGEVWMNASVAANTFLNLVNRSKLLSADQLAPYAPMAGSRAAADGAAVAARLVGDRLLTAYQAQLLLNGWFRDFFVADKYKVLDLLGEGGMGRVYLCEQLLLERLVAVKQLQTGADTIPGATERFLREAVAVAALDHPNICRIYDADRTADGLYLVGEYIDGANLHQVVARAGPLPPGRAANYVRQAALGLQHAHERGLVHRDIKPGNLMVDRTGGVKVLDMGLARFFDARRNQDLTGRFDSRNVLGTAEFIAPEQAMNSSAVDIRADIYSLGCTLYFLLLGRFPYDTGTPMEKLKKHQTEPFDRVDSQRPDVPAGLLRVLDVMVAKSPAERYPDPAAAAAALDPWAAPSSAPGSLELPTPGPTSFRLGLCPPPAASEAVAASPTPHGRLEPTPIQPTPAARPAVVPADPNTATVAMAAVDDTAPHDPLGLTDPSPRLTRRRLAVAVAALVVFAVSVVTGTWAGYRLGRPPEPTAPLTVSGPAAATLSGGGSTFAKPLVDVWVDRYAASGGPAIRYQGLGSGRGVRQMTEQVLDFAATDYSLSDADLTQAAGVGGPVVHVPLMLGAVVPTYRVPGLTGTQLKFTGPLLADIYLGNVTRWDDPAVRANNPGVMLPPLPIVPIRRADDSGTSFIFTRLFVQSRFRLARHRRPSVQRPEVASRYPGRKGERRRGPGGE